MLVKQGWKVIGIGCNGARCKRTGEEAADTLIWFALAEAPGETTGECFHNRDVIAASDAATDDDAVARLWQASEQLVARLLEENYFYRAGPMLGRGFRLEREFHHCFGIPRMHDDARSR